MKKSKRLKARERFLHEPPIRFVVLADKSDKLKELATKMRLKARNWRGFRVGGAAIGQHHDGSCQIFVAGNYKPRKQGGRHCAEELILRRAKRVGCRHLIGIVIVAAHQPDDKSGIDLGVLIPCAFCRRMFRAELRNPNSIISLKTLLILINVDRPDLPVELTVERILNLFPQEAETS